MNSIAQLPKHVHQAAERAARILRTRPEKTEVEKSWLLDQANHHRDEVTWDREKANLLQKKGGPSQDNKWRMKKKADRVEAVGTYIQSLEPGTTFTADAVRGWWIENRPPGDLVPTVAVMRRDTATYLEEGYLEIVPKVRQSAPMAFLRC